MAQQVLHEFGGDVPGSAGDGADLFAATSKGLYWSRNGGATWVTRYNNSAVGEFQTLATDGAVLLAGTSKGLFASRNQGMTWERRR